MFGLFFFFNLSNVSLYFRSLTSYTLKMLILSTSAPDGFCVSQLQRLTKEVKKKTYFSCYTLAKHVHTWARFTHPRPRSLTHLWEINMIASLKKKNSYRDFHSISYYGRSEHRRRKKIHLVQHAATKCGQMFVLADQKCMSLLYLTISARSISYWLQSSVRKCVLSYQADLCKIGPWCHAC